MPLTALPYEVLDLVCGYLATPQLCSLREACRRCDAVASKLLWRRLVIDLDGRKSIPGQCMRIAQLNDLSSCLERLDLVRELYCILSNSDADCSDAALAVERLRELETIRISCTALGSAAYAWAGQVTRMSPNAAIYADLSLTSADATYAELANVDPAGQAKLPNGNGICRLNGKRLAKLRIDLCGTKGPRTNVIAGLFDPAPDHLLELSVRYNSPVCDWDAMFCSLSRQARIELECGGDYDDITVPAAGVSILKDPSATIALKSSGDIKDLCIGHIDTGDGGSKNRAPLGGFITAHKSTLVNLDMSSLRRGEFLWHELFSGVFPFLKVLSVSCLLWQGKRRKGASFPSLIELNVAYFTCRDAAFYIPESNVLPESLLEDLLLDFVSGSPSLCNVLLLVEPGIHVITPARQRWVAQIAQSCYTVDCRHFSG